MITNEELDWATDLPLYKAWEVVIQYNRIIKALEIHSTPELVQQRNILEKQHPGITWLIDYKRSHPIKGEIPLSYIEESDYKEYDRRTRYIENYLKNLPKKFLIMRKFRSNLIDTYHFTAQT